MSEPFHVDGDGGAPSGAVDGDGPPRAARRRGRRAGATVQAIPESGPWAICYLIASTNRFAYGHDMRAEPHPMLDQWWRWEQSLAGAAILRWTRHMSCDWSTAPACCSNACKCAQRQVAGSVSGFLYYEVLQWCRCSEWPRAEPLCMSAIEEAALRTRWVPLESDSMHGAETFDDIVQAWSDATEQDSLVRTYCLVEPGEICHTFDSLPACLLAVALPTGRLPHRRRLLHRYPAPSMLKLLVADAAQHSAGQMHSLKSEYQIRGELTAEEYVEFLEASATAKKLRDLPRAGKSWCKILQRHNQQQPLSIAIAPCYEVCCLGLCSFTYSDLYLLRCDV